MSNSADQRFVAFYLIDNRKLQEIKKGQLTKNIELSQEVNPTVQNSNLLLEDLKLLSEIMEA
jgi:hypothetical protein